MNTLINKQYKSYDSLSRYATFPYYYDTVNEKYIYGTTSYLKDDTQYSIYKVLHNDTYDSIALKHYNNPTYFWIICDFNRIQDPFGLPKEGDQLKIPSISQIEFNTQE